MIESLIRSVVRNPILVLLLAAVAGGWGWVAFRANPKDAIPDIAENQVIVAADWPGRSPKDVDEQVTYPMTVALQGLPGVHEVRATSGFGWGIITVIFDDGIDFYWGRDRVRERLDTLSQELPPGVSPRLGPDATALGQVFWYTVENGWYCPRHPGLRFRADGTVDPSARGALPAGPSDVPSGPSYRCPVDGGPLERSRLSLDALRSIQDYQVKLALESVSGVSEVASVGGFVREYHVDLDPESLRAFAVTVDDVAAAVRASNLDVGAEVIEESGTELLVRGAGFLGGEERNHGSWDAREAAVIRDLEAVVLKAEGGTPVTMAQVAKVSTGPGFRRGALDKEGAEAVGASVIMRFGDNPLEVISRVKEGIREVELGLPPGVRINAFYDRSDLIERTLGTLGDALGRELLVTIAVVLIFLLHFRASLTVAVTLPLAVLLAFAGMEVLGVGSNIMSLAGIAIAIGTMVDMAIVMTENIYQHLVPLSSGVASRPLGREDRHRRIVEAAREVGPAIATAIATTVISFLPVFLLEGQSGKLFAPLAWTKTLCLLAAAAVALLVVPAVASITLAERRLPRGRSAWLAAIAGVVTALLWIVGASLIPALDELRSAVCSALAVPRPVDALAVGALGGFAVWSTFREQLRPPEENPVSRVIQSAYDRVLGWALCHPVQFLAIPGAIVVVGLAIWLGTATLVGPVLDAASWVGLGITDWSLAWWIHLVVGAALGLGVLPLLLDTASAVRGRSVVDLRRAPGGRIFALSVVSLVTALFLHLLGFAAVLPPSALHALGLPYVEPVTGEPGDVHSWAPVRVWRGRSTGIGQEYMPPLDEGDFLYMPSLLPAASINTVMDVMQKQDIQIAAIPEVKTAVGKLGRIDSSLDPAPLGMVETLVALKPRQQWPRFQDPDHPDRFRRRTNREVWNAIQEAGRFPGVLPSVELQPIRARVEMLSTGLNAEIGLKVFGDTLVAAEDAAVAVEALLHRELEGVEAINAVRTNNKPYLEIYVDREAAARYGIASASLQRALEVAVGGVGLTTTFEGLQRYPVRVRYAREIRDDPRELGRILISTPQGVQVPVSQVATFKRSPGPMSIRREGARYVSYVTLSGGDLDDAALVAKASLTLEHAVEEGRLELPPGTQLKWTGTYERHLAAKKRLAVIIPLVLAVNGLLLFLHFRRLSLATLVFLAVPVSFAGGFMMLRVWPSIHNALYRIGVLERAFDGDAVHLTVAVWVGFIALFGIAVDDGIVMGTYLQRSFRRKGVSASEEIDERVAEAGRRRIRPCLMTTVTTVVALLPVLLSTGSGSDVMVPMALPVFGGMLFELVSLFVVPVCFAAYLRMKWRNGWKDPWFQRQGGEVASGS